MLLRALKTGPEKHHFATLRVALTRTFGSPLAIYQTVSLTPRGLAPRITCNSAAVPLVGLTAWQALFEHGRLSADQSVLIHGAGGGVGVFAVQLACASVVIVTRLVSVIASEPGKPE